MTADLEELKAAALAATPGPWFAYTIDSCSINPNQAYFVSGPEQRAMDHSVGFEKADAELIVRSNPTTILALIERLKVAEDAAKDTERLDFIAAHPEMQLSCHKKRWGFIGFTNYEFDTFLTPREAIDAAIAARRMTP